MSVGVNVMLRLLDLAARALARVRRRGHRSPPQTQGRRPQRHRAGDGRDGGARARPRPGHCRACSRAKATPASATRQHRLCHRARRRHRRRTHGAVRRHRRAHRDHHKSSSRANYAEGSLRAARFLAGRARPVRHGRRARPEAAMDGLAQFWAQSDGVGRSVALLLLAMSVTAWVLILWKGWLLRRAARTSHAPCRPSGTPATLDEGRSACGLDREQVLLPLVDAAESTPAGGTLETAASCRPSSRGACATRCTAVWRTCSSARCCWPASAARRPSSGCSAPSGASTTPWWAWRRPAASASTRSVGPDRRSADHDRRRHCRGRAGRAGLQRLRQVVAACEAELEGFAHDLREMVLDTSGGLT
jgi:biopolymer transport protein ExbB